MGGGVYGDLPNDIEDSDVERVADMRAGAVRQDGDAVALEEQCHCYTIAIDEVVVAIHREHWSTGDLGDE